LFSVLAISWWLNFWLNLAIVDSSNWVPYGGAIWWHGHEMLFGFGVAIVVGFLLTAVKTWTGVTGLSGLPLAGLTTIWLLGRVFIALGAGIHQWIIAIIDISFLVFSAAAMAYPVFKVKQWRNLMFIPILLLLASLNGLSHWAVHSDDYLLASKTLHATIMVFVLLISILGGRVIPFFTANATTTQRLPNILLLDVLAILSILILVALALLGFQQSDKVILLIVSGVACVSNTWRFLRWGIQYTLKTPLLWSLHLSFIFIPFGFIFLVLFSLGVIGNISIVLHSFTLGAIGGMILAMISRVSLGHTGRPLKEPKIMKFAFAFILTAALTRTLVPVFFPAVLNQSILVSGILWIASFGLYLYFYAPMLVTTRKDGRAG
ncbi:MAG: NnrS family protein, partial [Kangiellaceae bacterium]